MNPTYTYLATLTLLLAVGSLRAEQPPADTADFKQQIAELVEAFDARSSEERRDAEKTLVQLAGKTAVSAERVLRQLPKANDHMPPAIRSAIARVRRQIEQRLASTTSQSSRITLEVKDAPLAEVLQTISQQTGNLIRDNRENFGDDVTATRVTISIEDEPFWPAMDRLLDEAGMSIYAYGGTGELALVARGENVGKRVGKATYAGPLRFEPIRVVSTRGLRDKNEESLDIDLEISWEPRLRPIALSQPLADLRVVAEGGVPLSPRRPEQNLDVEVAPGSQATELRISLVLPDRKTRSIASLGGTLKALAPGRIATFRFENIGSGAMTANQKQGNATVTVDRFFKNNAIWELRMRLQLDNAGDALASHRGWVFQNTSYLVDAKGNRIEHAGFETTLQNENQVGLAYFFDFSDEEAEAIEEEKEGTHFDPQRLTWVYETPTSIVELPIKYELTDILLP